ncbi:MAG: CopG family transcriptional regulator [Desulfosarcina sp.]|nr:CopG family transcriptional regulator [Desulfosarcina sp.]MBC2764541.1 CopG family transcriptional regulator [Desulfosarcina sp.]
MKAKALDKKFDEGKNVLKHFDLSKATKPGLQQKRVNVDFPLWMIQRLDKEAKRLGVPRQSLIKVWIAEKLENSRNNGPTSSPDR